jgi:hypothetical protein
LCEPFSICYIVFFGGGSEANLPISIVMSAAEDDKIDKAGIASCCLRSTSFTIGEIRQNGNYVCVDTFGRKKENIIMTDTTLPGMQEIDIASPDSLCPEN